MVDSDPKWIKDCVVEILGNKVFVEKIRLYVVVRAFFSHTELL